MNGTPNGATNGNGKELVPASIVQLIFNQTKESIDDNTEAVKDLYVAINELSKHVIDPQSKKEIIDRIDCFEKSNRERQKEIINAMYAIRDANNIRKDQLEESIDSTCLSVRDLTKNVELINKETSKTLEFIVKKEDDINHKFGQLINRLKLFATIISVAVGLVGGIHIWVDRDINKTIDDKLNKSLETIIKSRPYSTWPPAPQISGQQIQQIPQLPEDRNEIRTIPER